MSSVLLYSQRLLQVHDPVRGGSEQRSDGRQPSAPLSSVDEGDSDSDIHVSEEALKGPSHPAARPEYDFEKQIEGGDGGGGSVNPQSMTSLFFFFFFFFFFRDPPRLINPYLLKRNMGTLLVPKSTMRD